MKKSVMMLMGLLAVQGLFGMTLKQRAERSRSTKFENLANTPIRVKGLGGTFWTIKSHDTNTFQTGLQDNLVVEMGVPAVAHLEFDLKNVQNHFAEFFKVKFVPNDTLQFEGRLRRDSAKRDEERDEQWHLTQLKNYCSAMGCELTKQEDQFRWIVSGVPSVREGRQEFKGSLESTTRITHPTKLVNKTLATPISVKGAGGFSYTIGQGKQENFQTGLQDLLEIKIRQMLVRFDLTFLKRQFSWIQQVEFLEQGMESFFLYMHGIVKGDLAELRNWCKGGVCSGVREEPNGTVSVLGLRPLGKK
jgi:hypothetical protein